MNYLKYQINKKLINYAYSVIKILIKFFSDLVRIHLKMHPKFKKFFDTNLEEEKKKKKKKILNFKKKF